MKRILLWLLFLTSLSLFGCVQQNLSKQDKFLSASPHSILIVPVVNKSVDVTATDYMLSTLTIPLAERGYYVFPLNAVKRVLEDDGLADSSLVHSSSASKLASLFGADAVLYVVIERWDAQYMLLSTQVTVAFNYQIKDGKTDDVLWENREQMVYTPQQQNSGNPIVDLVAMAVTAAITKAAPNYMPLAHQANAKAFLHYPGSGIPFGPYALAEERNSVVPPSIRKQETTSSSLPNTIVTSSLPQEEEWWASINGQKEGPFKTSKIKELLSSGKITNNTYVWKEGMANWKRISDSPFAMAIGTPTQKISNINVEQSTAPKEVVVYDAIKNADKVEKPVAPN